MTWYEILFLKYLKGLPSKARMFLKLAKGGTMQLLPENDDEPETSPFLGTIRYPDASSDVEDEFTYKQSSYTGQARIKSIKGNTLVWNQLVENGNFVDTSKWSIANCTLSVSNNVCTLSASTSGAQLYQPNTDRGYSAGTKFFVSCEVKSSANRNVRLRVSQQSPVGEHNYEEFSLSANANTRICMVKSILHDIANVRFSILFPGSENGDTYEVKNFFAVNLTQMPLDVTADQFKSLFSLPYYAHGQYLLNFNGTGIKTTGKNLMNAEDVQVGKAWNNGSNSARATTFISVQPNTQYTLSYQSLNGLEQVFATQLNSIGGSTVGNVSFSNNKSVFTTASDCYYIAVQGNKTNITKADYVGCNFQLELGSSATSYEPYTSSTLSLPISTYFPTGMKSAGTIYDELSDKAITRVGSVDLGSLTWTYKSNYGMFTTGIQDTIKRPSSETVMANVICPIRQTDTWQNLFSGGTSSGLCAVTPYGEFGMSTTETNATTFKSAMSGVYLNYELATYTEQDVDPEDTQIMLNRALSTVLGRNVSVDNPQEALNILTKGE